MEQFHPAVEQQYLPDVSSIYDFQYQGLETGTTIRLLTFVNTPSIETNQNYIFVHLEHVDLNQNPVFNALSYVWGDHRPPVNQKYNSKRAQQIFYIICNGRKKRVTYNLFCFLRRLTAALPSGPLWNIKDTRIWIDQLCVNQSDDAEKAVQVSMMNRVYSQARSVVSWLGESDIQTNKAVTVLNSLRSIPQSLITQPDFDVAQFVKNTSNHDWVALGALLSRPYFKRAWIVQEIAMANELLVVCGDLAIPWDDLVHCSRILEESRAWTMLSRFAIVFGPVEDQMSSNRIRSHVRFGGQLSAVLEARNTIKDVSASSETLLLVGRQFDATVTVDKFYSMVGLAQLRLKNSGLANFPTIDYGRNLREVALDFAKYYIRTSGSLSILSRVEDSANRTPENQDFPSWLPDPAAPLLPLPLDAGVTHGTGSSPWRVRGNAPFKKPPSIDGSSLRVHGQRICSIKRCAVPFNILSESGEWFQIFDFMSELSNVNTGAFKLGEALWRTLITSTDSSSDPLPTPELWFDSMEKYNEEKRIKDDVKTAKKLETALIRLSQLAPDDIFPNAQRIRATADKLDPLRVDGPGVKKIRARIDRFKAALGMKLDSRRLFVTEDGRIGIGPQSLLETDEIWALDGVDVPMIIRKGYSKSFRFIGEAFVFGIMHGEVAVEDPSQVLEVVLE
ncbi:heterokaryon incompatibility protein-domain-containing protein [Ilyonectria destructans]|nr:heterokaryon incompatibility protein-domain-containing protein [Ilyonectria destructans]